MRRVSKGMLVLFVSKGMMVGLVVPLVSVTVDVIAFITAAGTRSKVQRQVIDCARLLLDAVGLLRLVLRWSTTAVGLGTFRCSRHRCMDCSKVAHHGFVLLLLVGVDCLCMLAKIVESGELLSTVTSKGTFASMFPMDRQYELFISNAHTRS